jgi:hypothetical protein
MKTFTGKFLIRRSKLKDGKEVFIVSGIAFPKNFSIEEISNRDEVWCAELGVLDSIEYENINSIGFHGGPEEFLSGIGQDVISEFSQWKKKDELKTAK